MGSAAAKQRNKDSEIERYERGHPCRLTMHRPACTRARAQGKSPARARRLPAARRLHQASHTARTRCSMKSSWFKSKYHADRILQEIGMEIRGDATAIRLWKDAGAEIEGESRVRVPMGLARQIVKRSAPAEFIQHARNAARSVHDRRPCHRVRARLRAAVCLLTPTAGAATVRSKTSRNFVKLTYMSPWLHHSGGTVCEPTDLPVNKRHLDMLYAHMTLSDKPFMGSVTTASRAADSIEMCRILFGAGVSRNSLRHSRATSTSTRLWCSTARRAASFGPMRPPIRLPSASPSSWAARWAP